MLTAIWTLTVMVLVLAAALTKVAADNGMLRSVIRRHCHSTVKRNVVRLSHYRNRWNGHAI